MENVEILTYSSKAIVVTGNTKPIKDRLKALGGAWNARLTHPATKERMMGWIFSKHKHDKVVLICTEAARENIIGSVDISTPRNINDKSAEDYIPDPGEVAADSFVQSQPGI